MSSEAADLSGVRQVYSTESAFAALTSQGQVVAWGGNGGDTSDVQDQLQSGVRSIASTTEAFAALDLNGGLQLGEHRNLVETPVMSPMC